MASRRLIGRKVRGCGSLLGGPEVLAGLVLSLAHNGRCLFPSFRYGGIGGALSKNQGAAQGVVDIGGVTSTCLGSCGTGVRRFDLVARLPQLVLCLRESETDAFKEIIDLVGVVTPELLPELNFLE